MNERALRILEFHKIREQLAQFAASELGREQCLMVEPLSTLEAANSAQQETEEALYVLSYRGDSPVPHSTDVRPFVQRAEKGSVLSPRMLLDIAYSLQAARQTRAALSGDSEYTRLLTELAARLQPVRSLETDILEAIISEEQIADQASSELASIRRQIRLCNDRVRDKLNALIHQPSYAKYLQEPIITVRNGRYVIPVRQEYRQNIQGLVHDQSSSGATLFIEPIALVELGNELKQWTAKEEQEIERILAALSAKVADSAQYIENNVWILGRLDFIFAKARLAQAMDAVRPKLNDRSYIRFIKVRHPLISRETVVPCDLWLGDDFTTLVITGPNTGGKTVTLKTVGLMTLMAQSGLHVPGSLGTECSLFGEVYADIGDEQSIEQSLSTFSSHMTNIVSILENVADNSLVLFDELGAGTDPTEGAALAQAILARLKKHGIRTIATTHYSELKAFALTTAGVENASVEFDVSTLRPTYRLSIGIPGKSNAFDISRRLGLSDSLIREAQALLSAESVRFEDVIANAEYHRQIAEKERKMAADMMEEAASIRRSAEKLQREADEKYQNIQKKAREDARKLLEKTKRESASIMAELKLLKETGGRSAQALSQIGRRLTESEDALAEGLAPRGEAGGLSAKDIKAGDSVLFSDLGTPATVLSAPDAKGEVMIQAGIIKMKVAASQLKADHSKRKENKTSVHSKLSGARKVSMECDVRGLSLDEALMEVDNYLDMAVMNGLNEVSIIHGKGTGTLRSGIQKHLKQLPSVKSYRLGVYGEGEDGVTVVTLK